MIEVMMAKMSSAIEGILAKLNLCDTKLNEIETGQTSTNTSITTVGTKVDGVQTTSNQIKTMISSEVKTAITNAKKEIIAAMPSGSSACVKSVQRGRVSFGAYDDYKDVKLTSVNIQKTIVILNGVCTSSGTYIQDIALPYVGELTSTELTIYRNGDETGSISWQVIEFY